jgi:hypothetical protein
MVRTETTRFRDDGATLKDSNVVHACASNLDDEDLELLLECAHESERREILSCFDCVGYTPLMVATVSGLGTPEELYYILEKLIELGADKDIGDASGETALGSYRGQRQLMNDFRNTFGLSSQHQQIAEDAFHQRLELLPRPSGGPTSANDSYLLNGNQRDERRRRRRY